MNKRNYRPRLREYITRFFELLDLPLTPHTEFPEGYRLQLNIPEGLDSPEARVIYALAYGGKQESSMIAARLADSVTATEKTLDDLVKLGLVRFTPGSLSRFFSETDAELFGTYELTSFDTRRSGSSKPQPNL